MYALDSMSRRTNVSYCLRAVEHVLHDRDAELLGDVEAHRRELDRHVRVELLLVDAVENVEVLVAPRRALRARW